MAGARASKSWVASSVGRPASGHTRSPPMPSTSRDVASTRRRDVRPSRSSTTAATASTTCSQLSSTSSFGRASIQLASCSSPTPSAAAMAGRTPASSSTPSSPTHHASTAAPSATSVARRVLPTPPGPTTVTSRSSASAAATPWSSAARPTKLVSGRRMVGRAAGPGSSDESCRRIAPSSADRVGPGSEAQLVGEPPAGNLVCGERVGLPSAPLQRQHQLLAQTLPQRMSSDERPQFSHRSLMPTEREVGVDPRFLRAQVDDLGCVAFRLASGRSSRCVARHAAGAARACPGRAGEPSDRRR